MKITKLYLQNFAAIKAGLNGLKEVTLDFTRNDKVINIIIGKMGSCKTVILGQLQPWHTFGTLDPRNQDNVISLEEDGEKVIEYSDGDDIYSIDHEYQWNKTTGSHAVKHYIQKNGDELNPNGNLNTFNDCIENIFGIDQNYLKICRLGSNVTNLIDMKTADRKNYFSNLCKSAEIYTLVYKKINTDMKGINSQLSIIGKKLIQYSDEKKESMKDLFVTGEKEIQDIDEEINQLSTKGYEKLGHNAAILNGLTVSQFRDKVSGLKQELSSSSIQYRTLVDEMNEVNTFFTEKYGVMKTIPEISREIGAIDNSIESLEKRIFEEEQNHDLIRNKLIKLKDKKMILGDDSHVKEMEIRYSESLQVAQEYRSQLSGFSCKYNSLFLRNLVNDLYNINTMISRLLDYDKKIIKSVYFETSAVLTRASKKVDILFRKKLWLKKEKGNVEFSKDYEATIPLFLPPFCPTKTCPYYLSHPFTVKISNKKKSVINDKMKEYDDKIASLDIEIAFYEAFSEVYPKTKLLKEEWSKIVPPMKEIGAMNTTKLIDVLTDYSSQVWYNHDRLMKYIELTEKREALYKISGEIDEMKEELRVLKGSNFEDVEKEISDLENKLLNITASIKELEKVKKEKTSEMKYYNEAYEILSKININYLKSEKENLSILERTIEDMEDNLKDLYIRDSEISSIRLQVDNIRLRKKGIRNEMDKIRTILNDLAFSEDEYSTLSKKYEYLKLMMDATSPTKGIPLVFIQIFLDGCRDIVNDLISEVFGDTLEIIKFNVSDSEFTIPYRYNGTVVNDISKASQGQSAIISLALSFAIVRQVQYSYSNTIKYNIMLLDEMDGPLYKSDREKFISILMHQLKEIRGEQIFLTSHNGTFDGHNVNIIMTTEEYIDPSPLISVMRVQN